MSCLCAYDHIYSCIAWDYSHVNISFAHQIHEFFFSFPFPGGTRTVSNNNTFSRNTQLNI